MKSVGVAGHRSGTTPARRWLAILALGTTSLLLGGCGPTPLVRAGSVIAAGTITLDTPVEWSRFGDSRVELWTRDGTRLNQLQFVGDVEPGQHVFRSRRESQRRPDGAYFRSGLDGLALQALVLDGLAELGAVKPMARGLQPARFGDGEAVRFEIDTSNQDGLVYRGIAQASVHRGKLFVMLFLAPGEHYFERDAALVRRMFDSARPKAP